MRRHAVFFVALFAISNLPALVRATLIVDPAQPITRQVTVQLIQTALNDDGSVPATVMGTASQRSIIEAGIDKIWAQAGIDILMLPTVTLWGNKFAYQGDDGNNNPRPSGDLDDIINMARTAGKLNTTSTVINMFFVNIVPAFSFTTENTSNGLANLGHSGIAAFTGDSLVTYQNGQDVVSSVLAHEIGHNLGLSHTGSSQANLMSPNGSTEQLNSTQITTARNSSFALPFSALIAGDYNRDGVVNAADYSLWRDTLGSTTNLTADGNGNHVIDTGDLTVWRANFGKTSGAGSIASQLFASNVPEPTSTALILLGIVVVAIAHRSASSRARA